MRNVGILLRKELTDVLRDRRTLIIMCVVPILLYPVVLLALGGLMVAGKERLARAHLRVALIGAEARALLKDAPAPAHTLWVLVDREEAVKGLRAEEREKRIDAAVELAPGSIERLEHNGQAVGKLYYTKRSDE